LSAGERSCSAASIPQSQLLPRPGTGNIPSTAMTITESLIEEMGKWLSSHLLTNLD